MQAPRRVAITVIRTVAVAAVVSALALSTALSSAAGTDAWELRACAPPQSLPFSDIAEAGFENRIAEIVADEVGAELTYDWVAFTPDLVNLHFAEGTCDVILGVPDGFEQVANTVTYYQSPYVSVYRADAGFDIESLDDPALADLEIGIQGAGTPPHAALLQRGLSGNITHLYGDSLMSDDRHASLVQAVERGEIDIGFGWGPSIGYWGARSAHELVIRPVEPQFEPPSSFQSIPMTMGVRQNDLALRDLLSRAIVARWDDIQAVLADFDVPLTPGPPPFAGEPLPNPAAVVLNVGVVLPTPTGGRTYDAAINDIVGRAALQGALLAEGLINARADETGTDIVAIHASAPSTEAALRAARRLLATHDLSALVGGVGDGQAAGLATVAAEHDIAFLNVGSSDVLLRERCEPTTFHVEPSPETYLNALLLLTHEEASADDGEGVSWFVVHLEDERGAALSGLAQRLIAANGDLVAGSADVALNTPTYGAVVDEISASAAEAILVLLPAAEQLTFMGQYDDFGGDAILAPYPYIVTQTRNFLAATLEYGITASLPRLLSWETTLADGRAGALNSRFTSRWGQPLDPPAWTTYEALMILEQAALATRSSSADDISAYLADPANTFSTAKGSLAFTPDHQLQQRIYAVTLDPAGKWGLAVTQKVGVARLAAVLDAEPPSGPGCTSLR